jgi:hypothetical protein
VWQVLLLVALLLVPLVPLVPRGAGAAGASHQLVASGLTNVVWWQRLVLLVSF